MKKKLKRYLFIIVFASIVALSVTVYNRYYVINEDTLYEAHLRIVSTKSDGQTKFGSAVIFDGDRDYYYALTNHHVVDGSNNVDAIDYMNNRYDVEVINSTATFDLAMIKIERSERLRTLDFADDIENDSEVIAIGYPQSIFTLTDGVISNIEQIDHEVTIDVIHHSAVIDHGSSGGALVNNNYEIVGINFAGYVDANDVVTESYAIPSARLITYIDSIDYA